MTWGMLLPFLSLSFPKGKMLMINTPSSHDCVRIKYTDKVCAWQMLTAT